MKLLKPISVKLFSLLLVISLLFASSVSVTSSAESELDQARNSYSSAKKEYEKLCFPLKFKVEYLYVFNDWFKQTLYRDTLEYIENVGCHYFYNEIPLDFLGL